MQPLGLINHLPPEIITIKIIPNSNIQALHALSQTCTKLASMTKDFRYRLKSLMPILENTDNSIEYLVNSAYKKYLKKEDDLFTELKLKKLGIFADEIDNHVTMCSKKLSNDFKPFFELVDKFLKKLKEYPTESIAYENINSSIQKYKEIFDHLDWIHFIKENENVNMDTVRLNQLIEKWVCNKVDTIPSNSVTFNIMDIMTTIREYEKTVFPKLDTQKNLEWDIA